MENEIRLVQTCFACPEQYDAFIGDRQVGYLRLRHGCFRVDYPAAGGETIYRANPQGDGIFEYEERGHYLAEAKKAILNKLNTNIALTLPEEIVVSIHDKSYRISEKEMGIGDMCMDRRDGHFGICNYIDPTHENCALDENGFVELGVPIKACYVLEEIL